MSTNVDLELTYLTTGLGAAGPTLDDARFQVYGANKHAYFATLSGLTPAGAYSLADHQRRYYEVETGLTGLSIANLSRAFWAAELGL